MATNTGTHIKLERTKRGISQAALGRSAGLNHGHLCRIEANKIEPNPETLLKIAKAIGVSVACLGGEEDGGGIGDRIRKARILRHVSIEALDQLAGLEEGATESYEAGTKKPSKLALVAIEQALGASVRGPRASTAALVRDARLAAGMSQPALERACGLTAQHVSKIECGRAKPTTRTLAAISKALKVSVDSLIGE